MNVSKQMAGIKPNTLQCKWLQKILICGGSLELNFGDLIKRYQWLGSRQLLVIFIL